MTSSLRSQLAQRLVIDLRNFAEAGQALAPVTELSPSLVTFLTKYQFGGVILFAENCTDAAQMRRFTAQLQATTNQSPLLISIDQEGGRVLRTGRQWSTAFAGNMALGACAEGESLAYRSAFAIGSELNALGINMVHAPCVDVNNNPDNPVINVRSYGDSPKKVASLARQACAGFLAAGLIPTLKHFPGHGDTATDSHTGLPRVDHCAAQLAQTELAPYQSLLSSNAASEQNLADEVAVMTAHVQFPNLDSSTIAGQIRPATMSATIINKVLRQQLGFNGVVISDALDMAAIAKLMPMEQAVTEVLAAGVDIAMMPIKIRSEDDFAKAEQLLQMLEQAVATGRIDPQQHLGSVKRIAAMKQRLLPQPSQSLAVVGCDGHRQLELTLAQQSITAIKGMRPSAATATANWLLLLPGKALTNGLTQALAQCGIEQVSAIDISHEQPTATQLDAADIVLGGFVSPRPSAAELGGVDDLSQLDEQTLIRAHQPQRLLQPLQQANQLAKPVIFLSLRAPYDAQLFGDYADWVLASYGFQPDGPQQCGATLLALARVLTGQATAQGQLPIALTKEPN